MVTIRRLACCAAGATVVLTLAAAAPAAANPGRFGHGPHSFRHIHHAPDALFGTVSAVKGTTTTGTCGVAASAGNFTLTRKAKTDTVDVSTTTPFSDRDDPSPSFADVCVGDPAGAIGMLSGTTLTASFVFVPTYQRGPRTFSHQGTKPIPFADSAHTLGDVRHEGDTGDGWNGEREAGPSTASQPSWPSHSWGGTDHGAPSGHQFGHSPH
jgi:hypothetical protein